MRTRAAFLAAFAALLLSLIVVPSMGSSALATDLPESISLEASEVQHDIQADQLEARGDVRLATSAFNLETQFLHMNLLTHMATAVGEARLVTDDRSLIGRDIKYNWETGEGEIDQPRTTVEGVIVDGRSAVVTQDELQLQSAALTKCDLPSPEYQFKARKVKVDNQTDRLKAEGVSLWLYGHRIIGLPNMQMSLKNTWVGQLSREKLPVPEAGYDTNRGYYVRNQFSYLLSDRALARVGIEYGSTERFGSTLFYATELSSKTRFVLDADYAEVGSNRPSEWDGSATLTTNVAGVSGRAAWESRHDDDSMDLVFWPEVALTKSLSSSIGSLTPTLSWAKVDEAVTGVSAERTEAQIALAAVPISIGKARLSLSGTGRFDDYGTYGQRQILGGSAGLSRSLTPAFSGSLTYRRTVVTGGSPFLFDNVDPANDLVLGGSLHGGGAVLSLSSSYDLDSREIDLVTGGLNLEARGWKLGVTGEYEPEPGQWTSLRYSLIREGHCFDITLRYDKVARQFSAGVVLRR